MCRRRNCQSGARGSHLMARGPNTDFERRTSASSLDDLVSSDQYRLRNCYPEGLRSLQVDDELEFGRLFDRNISSFDATNNLVHESRCLAIELVEVRPEREQATRDGNRFVLRSRGQAILKRELSDTVAMRD